MQLVTVQNMLLVKERPINLTLVNIYWKCLLRINFEKCLQVLPEICKRWI